MNEVTMIDGYNTQGERTMERLVHLDNACESLEDAVAALIKAHKELQQACDGQFEEEGKRKHLAELKAMINEAETLISSLQA